MSRGSDHLAWQSIHTAISWWLIFNSSSTSSSTVSRTSSFLSFLLLSLVAIWKNLPVSSPSPLPPGGGLYREGGGVDTGTTDSTWVVWLLVKVCYMCYVMLVLHLQPGSFLMVALFLPPQLLLKLLFLLPRLPSLLLISRAVFPPQTWSCEGGSAHLSQSLTEDGSSPSPWYHNPIGTSEDHIDEGKLKERCKYEACAGEEPDVDELDIADMRHLWVHSSVQSDESEPARSAQRRSAWNGGRLQPERDPAHCDQHGWGDVIVDHKLADVPGEGDPDVEGAEVSHHLPLRHPAQPAQNGGRMISLTWGSVGSSCKVLTLHSAQHRSPFQRKYISSAESRNTGLKW